MGNRDLQVNEIIYNAKKDRVLTSPNHPNIYIPVDLLRNKMLKTREKIYLSMFYQYGNNEFYADTGYLEIFSKRSLLNTKRKLRKSHLLTTTINAQQAKAIVLQNKNKGGVCEWCGCRTNAIQEHHYPTPKSKGGKDVVKICPNCHSEYHLIFRGK